MRMTVSANREILAELKKLRERMDRIEQMLEERRFEAVEPFPDEVEALQEYEEEKSKGTLKLVKLEEV